MFKFIVSSLTVFAHLVLPFIFLIWIYRTAVKSKLEWLGIVALTSGYILLMWKGGAGWSWFGSYWPWIFLVLLIPAIFAAALQRRAFRARTRLFLAY